MDRIFINNLWTAFFLLIGYVIVFIFGFIWADSFKDIKQKKVTYYFILIIIFSFDAIMFVFLVIDILKLKC